MEQAMSVNTARQTKEYKEMKKKVKREEGGRAE